MFIDETKIRVKAGDGGNGCYAHERQRYRPWGRPSGGCGGRGGHILIQGNSQLHTLQDCAYRKSYKADRGQHGKGGNKDGRNGADQLIQVPLGTIVEDADTGQILYDCLEEGQTARIARGGRGGRGNAALKSPSNPNPEQVEPGREGEQKVLRLVLKILADVGLVGRPNAGKSTLLSTISRAHPKIADYPFTTTEPHLGIVKPEGSWDSFVVADIPGLIEGSHTGKGLGTRFLRHIERTRVLAIMVEATAEDPEAEAAVLLEELTQYSPVLAAKPKCFVLSKIDLVPDDSLKVPAGWISLSSISRTGIRKLLGQFMELLKEQQ
jgi:GTP-binding protein